MHAYVSTFDFSLTHRVFLFNSCSICGSIHGDSDLQAWKKVEWTWGYVYLAHMVTSLLSLPVYLPNQTTVGAVG